MLIKNYVGTQVRGYKYIYILSCLEIIFVLTQVEGKDFFFFKKGWRLKDGP